MRKEYFPLPYLPMPTRAVWARNATILVTSASPQNEQGENVYQQQNLISLEVSPNPSQGEFNALRRCMKQPPDLHLVRIDTGQIYETRNDKGLQNTTNYYPQRRRSVCGVC